MSSMNSKTDDTQMTLDECVPGDSIMEYPSPPLSPISTSFEMMAVSSLEPFYSLGPTIGRGEFAKVKLARSLANGQKVRVHPKSDLIT